MDDKFWVTVWKCATVGFVVLVLTIGGCSVHKRHTMVQMVEKGANPITAHCAVYMGDVSNSEICTIVALPQGEK